MVTSIGWKLPFYVKGKITREYTVISILVTYHVNQAKKQLTTAACRM